MKIFTEFYLNKDSNSKILEVSSSGPAEISVPTSTRSNYLCFAPNFPIKAAQEIGPIENIYLNNAKKIKFGIISLVSVFLAILTLV